MVIKNNKGFQKFSLFFLILLFIFTSLIVYLSPATSDFSDKNSGTISVQSDKTGATLTAVNSFTDIQKVDFPVNKGISASFVGTSTLQSLNNENFVVTFNSKNNISLNNIPLDILNGNAILENINIKNCIDVDQIAVQYVSKKCSNSLCYDRYGNRIENGTTIENLETRPGVPRCTGTDIGYVSFNFSLNSITNSISSSSLFAEINTLYLGTNVFKEYSSNSAYEYYFSNNLIVEDPYIAKDEIIPRIVHRPFNKNSFRQKISVQRYSKTLNNEGNLVFNQNNSGNLAEINFRPLGLFLTTQGVSNSIISIPDTISGINNLSGNFALRAIKQGNNTNAKCSINNLGGVSIIDGGSHYDNTSPVEIEGDNGTFTGSFKIKTVKNDERIVMEKITNVLKDEERAVWLLVPPLTLPTQGITKNNKLTNGYILNFSSQSPVSNFKKSVPAAVIPPYSKVNPGTIISPIMFTEVGSASPYNIFDSSITTSNIASLFDINDNLKSKIKLNNEIYQAYPPYILRAVNNYPAFANPVSLTNNGIVSIAMAVKESVLKTDFSLSIDIIEQDLNYTILDNDIQLDGTAEWVKLDPFTDVLAFEEDYFTNPSLSEGQNTVISISDITEENLSFITPIFGKINNITVTSANYDNIVLPALGTSVVNLDSTTLSLSENSLGQIGKDAKCLLTFGSLGTSNIIELAEIINPGSSFSTGAFNLLGSALQKGLSGSIGNILIETINDSYRFEAVTVEEDSATVVTPSDVVNQNIFNITYGLVIYPIKKETISLKNPTIVSGGQNYKKGTKYYINQYIGDSLISAFGNEYNGNSITTDNMLKLPSINVLGVSDSKTFLPDYRPLIRDQDGSLTIDYNFWEDSPGIYSSSPQQIVLYKNFIGTSSQFIGDPALDFLSFLKDNKIDNSSFTKINFLKSLQIPSFYYVNNDSFSEINPQEGLALKRFIPYKSFTPPVGLNDEKIPTKKGNVTYTNYNYTQFIPYGIENIYKQKFNNGFEDVPTF